MPVETFELLKLIGGLLIITIPGYLWSFLFSKQLTHLERLAFGFVAGLVIFSFCLFTLNVIFNIPITQNTTIVLFALYTIPVVILYLLSIYRFGLPKIDLQPIKNKKFILLLCILGFSFFMMLLPHWSNNYYLPFHVDEWIHWSYSRGVIESSSTVFTNTYTGAGTIANPEIGFHIATASIYWMSGANLLTIFLFMPSIIGMFLSLNAFNIGERAEKKYGLEAAFLIAFIPTTVRFLGPSFYVAITLGLLLLIFILWLGVIKKIQGTILIAAFLWCMFIVHPPTGLAGIIILFIYAIFLAIEKEYILAGLTGLFTALPLLIVYLLTTRWNLAIEMLMEAIHGKEYLQTLPTIWINFEHLGIVTWILFIVGVYFSFSKGKSFTRTLSISSIVLIIIIGVYDKFSYGLPIIYDRTFMYLFLVVTLIAGFGLSELRKTIQKIGEQDVLKKYKKLSKNIGLGVPIVVCLLLFTTAIPAHIHIPYYQMINEEDYETFTWIRYNIDDYRDENHLYDTAVVDPYKASPFSAVTGLYIICSRMHPLVRHSLYTYVEKFLKNKCIDTSFLDRYKISVIYNNNCNNSNLTMIHEKVYIYPGLYN